MKPLKCKCCDQYLRLKCKKCKHIWQPRGEVTICPKCKSAYWNKPKKLREGKDGN